tara:strand:- start:1120 stop:3450 length:2331 start_codon:yes stop_codon:yes gene_type:complete
MANEVEIRVTADASKAERGLKGLRGSLNSLGKSARVAGAALTAVGVGGAIAIGKVVASYKDQEIGIAKLNQSLINVGHTYQGNAASIETVIDAIQRKTNFGDEAQRESLQTLITIGGKYEGSLQALQVATDMAVGANMSLEGASLLLAKAIAGETSSLSRYGIKLAEGATQTEIMTALTEQFGGMAEAAADPMKQLGNRVGDTAQEFGKHLAPFIDRAAGFLERLSDKINNADPRMMKLISLIAGATAVFALIGGPILILIGLLPMLAMGFGVLATAMGPITIGLGIIAGAIALGILAWKNWDKIVEFVRGRLNKQFGWLFPGGKLPESIKELKNLWNNTWQSMKDWFFKIGRMITGGIEDIANGFIGMVNKIIDAAHNIGLLKDVARLDEFELSFDDMVESVGSKAIEMADKAKEGLTKVVEEVKTFTTDAVDDIKEGAKQGFDEILKLAGKTQEILGEFNQLGGIEEGLVGGMLAPGAPGAPTVPGGPTDPTAPGAAGAAAVGGGGGGMSGPRSGTRHFAREGGVTTLTTKAGVVTDAFSAIPQLEAQRGAGAKFLKASFDPAGRQPGETEAEAAKRIADFHKKQANWAREQESALIEIASMSNQTNRTKALTQFLNDVGGKSNIDSRLGKLFNRASSSDSNPTRSFGKGLSGKDTRLALEAMHHVQEAANRKWISENYMPIDKLGASLSGDVDWWAMRGLAKGGVVTRPTMALIGEAGPEAVIPLGKGGGMAPTINVTISGNTVFGEMDFKRLVVKAVTDSHRRGGLPFLGRA